MSIVKNIKVLCKQHGTSIPKLEKRFNFGHGAIYKWGMSDPGTNKIQKVAEYFNVSIEFLLNGIEQPPEPFDRQSVLKLAKDNSLSIGQVIEVLDDVKSAVLDEITI